MTITLQHIAETDSTNRLIRELNANRPLAHGHCLFADFQTAGKGQGTNHWESSRGENLLFSVWLKCAQFPLAEQFLLSEVVAVSVAQVLQQYLPNVQLKWPNDIYVGERKLGGILIETIIRGGVMEEAVVGIGLNVNQTVFKSDAPNPVSIKQLIGRDTDLQPLLAEIVSNMAFNVENYNLKQKTQWQQQYHSFLFWREGIHPFSDATGDFLASIHEVLPNGQLILQTPTERRGYFLKQVRFKI